VSAQIPQPIASSTDAAFGGSRENRSVPKDYVDIHRDIAEIVDTGDSELTPWILIGQVWVVTVVAVLTALAAALFAYRVA
jgi:hypothetical protein